MDNQSEKQILKIIKDYLDYQKDVYYIRNNSVSGRFLRKDGSQGWINNSKKGAPDLILLYKGRWIGLEVKTKKGKQSLEQQETQKHIQKCGGDYAIVRSAGEVQMLLGTIK